MRCWRRLLGAALLLTGCGGGGGGGAADPGPTYDARSAGLGEPVFAEVGQSASLRFEGATAGQEYWLILASLASPPGTTTAVVNSGTTTLPLLPELQVASRLRDQPYDAAVTPGGTRQAGALPALDSTRTFSVTAVGGSTVMARLRRIGTHCLLYVDQAVPEADFTDANLADLQAQFDAAIYPGDVSHYGEPVDVDANDRVIILFSPLLNARGYGAFYPGDLNGGSPNSADMLYVLVPQPDEGEPYDTLRPAILATLTHELQHLINYSRKVLIYSGASSDEVWINEAMSFLAEQYLGFLDSAGGSPENVAYYFASPERYTLRQLGSDYDDGHAGAAYLFLRYLADRFGDNLTHLLIESALRGPENVQAATGQPLDDLVLDWAAALLLDGTGLNSDGRFDIPSFDTRGDFQFGGQLTGPRATAVDAASGAPAFRAVLPHTGLRFIRLTNPAASGVTLNVTGAASEDLRAVLVRMPAQ